MQKLSLQDLGRKSADECRVSDKNAIVVVLENVRSAYNVGSAFRTCDAFLIQSLVLVGYTARPPHKEIRKTALGAEDSVDWLAFPDTPSAIEHLRRLGYRILAAEQTTESVPLQRLGGSPAEPVAVIFGNEVTGVEPNTLALCDGALEIPQWGMKHSLNVATALGVVLWELVRSRIPQPTSP